VFLYEYCLFILCGQSSVHFDLQVRIFVSDIKNKILNDDGILALKLLLFKKYYWTFVPPKMKISIAINLICIIWLTHNFKRQFLLLSFTFSFPSFLLILSENVRLIFLEIIFSLYYWTLFLHFLNPLLPKPKEDLKEPSFDSKLLQVQLLPWVWLLRQQS